MPTLCPLSACPLSAERPPWSRELAIAADAPSLVAPNLLRPRETAATPTRSEPKPASGAAK